ncbi:MAG: hypothetical protein EBU66_13570 [Bacteroidetes bacterium]|nr:hypothetical protein [bacterium]NBP65675.1 hypothetical protein [Bacteroidota bacterium]
MEIKDLPIELQYKIIRLLDIDTRRILGIYTHLKVPNVLKEKIDNIPKPICYNSLYAFVNLGPIIEMKYRNRTLRRHKYKLFRWTWTNGNNMIYFSRTTIY